MGNKILNSIVLLFHFETTTPKKPKIETQITNSQNHTYSTLSAAKTGINSLIRILRTSPATATQNKSHLLNRSKTGKTYL